MSTDIEPFGYYYANSEVFMLTGDASAAGDPESDDSVALYDAPVPAMIEALDQALEYVVDVPEAAVGGDDNAATLAREIRAILYRIKEQS